MSHSVPSDSSTADTMFVIGTDLVAFDRHDLPIYLTPPSRWSEACVEEAFHGAPLDRLFGEPQAVFIDGIDGAHGSNPMPAIGEDPLVVLNELCDGLLLPASDETAAMRESAAIYDFGADSHTVVHLHDGWSWDQTGVEWSFDHHA